MAEKLRSSENKKLCFNGWKVILLGDASKLEGFSRVLGIGGALVTCIRGEMDLVELSDLKVIEREWIQAARLLFQH